MAHSLCELSAPDPRIQCSFCPDPALWPAHHLQLPSLIVSSSNPPHVPTLAHALFAPSACCGATRLGQLACNECAWFKGHVVRWDGSEQLLGRNERAREKREERKITEQERHRAKRALRQQDGAPAHRALQQTMKPRGRQEGGTGGLLSSTRGSPEQGGRLPVFCRAGCLVAGCRRGPDRPPATSRRRSKEGHSTEGGPPQGGPSEEGGALGVSPLQVLCRRVPLHQRPHLLPAQAVALQQRGHEAAGAVGAAAAGAVGATNALSGGKACSQAARSRGCAAVHGPGGHEPWMMCFCGHEGRPRQAAPALQGPAAGQQCPPCSAHLSSACRLRDSICLTVAYASASSASICRQVREQGAGHLPAWRRWMLCQGCPAAAHECVRTAVLPLCTMCAPICNAPGCHSMGTVQQLG